MNDIIAMRRKNSPNSPSKIKELFQQISNNHFESDKILQKLKENEKRISELSKDVSALKEEHEVEEQTLQSKFYTLEEHNHLLQNLKEDKENLDSTLKDLVTKHNSMRNKKPSLRDVQLIETGKRKHKLYKEFTGIRFDYSAPETVIEGYITNKQDYLHKISYKSDIDYKKLRDLLWKDIQQSTMNSITTDIDYKENKPSNN